MKPSGVTWTAAVSVLMIALYVPIANITTRAPSAQPFAGWVAVVVPSDQMRDDGSRTHRVALTVSRDEASAGDSNPTVSYSVGVCANTTSFAGQPDSSVPFRATLLMGGDARLISPKYLPHDRTETEAVTAQSFSGVVKIPMSPDTVNLGPTDAISISIPEPVQCVPSLLEQDPPGFLGTPVSVIGRMLEPTRHRPSLLWFEGPRYSESWPLVGALPSPIPRSMGGTYTFEELPGTWVRPDSQVLDIYAGALPSRIAIEDSRPTFESPDALNWVARSPLAPSARLLDLDSQARWQQALVVASLLFGIAASLLAEVLLRCLGRPRSKTVGMPLQRAQNSNLDSPTDGSSRWATALVLVLLARRWLRTRGKGQCGRDPQDD
ncbi:Uncharacterised protein [Mycolicibacterium tokaiense]|uniref:Uncharacterized protein n=1 Tax=Mycolicibacterium tokaiense TaxID=39695 RepID=A0A378TA23_9MYCO|nr:Uncharacterised protein [Mycolicibacterium tokaiense]